MTKCLICGEALCINSLSCHACKTEYNGSFLFPRLARLNKEERDLTEALIIHGGNLKEMAQALDMSYPTLKKRLKALTLSLQTMQETDEGEIERVLRGMEAGRMGAKEGVKYIREINGEL